jgi:transcriptional regulator with XRE-family HTH domain
MSGHRPFDQLRRRMSPERRARNAAATKEMLAEMALHELRQARERSQEELARALKVRQPAVAKLERRTDMYVSNLRRYIEALGGSLEITARFAGARVTITNFGELAKLGEASGRILRSRTSSRKGKE